MTTGIVSTNPPLNLGVTEDPELTEAQANTAAAQQELVQGVLSTPETVTQKQETVDVPLSMDQLIPEGTGQTQEVQEVQPTTVQEVAQAETPEVQEAVTFEATQVSDQIGQAFDGVSAATAQPSAAATVQGQLETLMSDFEGGGTPPWASGAMRSAMAIMQSRGLGASSVAGQAVVQAAMESATAIAVQDAQTSAQFELTNLNNEQQTTILKTQQTIAGIFSDQAADNAAKQINASSKNQMTQFFSNLEASASQFNAAQVNAIGQFNASEVNATEQFNNTLKAQRDQFNAQNALVISQANAQWRQQIATTNTATQNAANYEYTKTVNSLTSAQIDQIWQRERDLLDYAFTSSESSLDRSSAVLLAKLGSESSTEALKLQASIEGDKAKGAFFGQIVGGLMGLL